MTAKHAQIDVARKQRPKAGEAPGKFSRVGLRERMSRHQIAKQSRIDSATIDKYLALEGAPKPDDKRHYNFKEVVAWIEANSTRVNMGGSSEMRKLKETILRMDAEEKAFDFGVKRGQYIAISEMEPAIAAFCTQLTDDLRTKFEFELPDKYEGKNAIERKEMNAAAIDWTLKRLKAGVAPLVATKIA